MLRKNASYILNIIRYSEFQQKLINKSTQFGRLANLHADFSRSAKNNYHLCRLLTALILRKLSTIFFNLKDGNDYNYFIFICVFLAFQLILKLESKIYFSGCEHEHWASISFSSLQSQVKYIRHIYYTLFQMTFLSIFFLKTITTRVLCCASESIERSFEKLLKYHFLRFLITSMYFVSTSKFSCYDK